MCKATSTQNTICYTVALSTKMERVCGWLTLGSHGLECVVYFLEGSLLCSLCSETFPCTLWKAYLNKAAKDFEYWILALLLKLFLELGYM